MPAERRTIVASVGGVVEVEAVDRAEAVAQGRADHRVARGRADEREVRHREPDRARAGPLADDEVEGEVLHRRVEDLLDGAREAVDLVDEEDVVLLEVREDGGEVAGALDRGAAGGADGDAHLVRDDVREGRLAEAGRAVEEQVVERFAALLRRLDGDAEVLLDAVLAGEVVEAARPQRALASPSSAVAPRREEASSSEGGIGESIRADGCSGRAAAGERLFDGGAERREVVRLLDEAPPGDRGAAERRGGARPARRSRS